MDQPWHESFSKKCLNFGIDTDIKFVDRVKYLNTSTFARARIQKYSVDVGTTFKWCEENLKNEWIWGSPTIANYVDLYFLNDQDALMFKLKFDTITT